VFYLQVLINITVYLPVFTAKVASLRLHTVICEVKTDTQQSYSPGCGIDLISIHDLMFDVNTVIGIGSLLLLLQSVLQPLVGFGLLYDFIPQSSISTLLSPIF
jgi:uncharacterized paraquat-inducible protein A